MTTTTKKLSEIGTHCAPSPHSYTQYEPYWTFSKEERRELVLLALTRWEESKVMAVSYGPTIEKFLEENGI